MQTAVAIYLTVGCLSCTSGFVTTGCSHFGGSIVMAVVVVSKLRVSVAS